MVFKRMFSIDTAAFANSIVNKMNKSTDKLNKLQYQFYCGDNVLLIARKLLGKIIVTNIDGLYTSARIVETEAYIAVTDRASHSYGGKRTIRNEHMYSEASISYVYTCYGIHQLFNVVTNSRGIPDAVLIRAGEPVAGVAAMLLRTGKSQADDSLTRGPGNLGKALGITKAQSGIQLSGDVIFIAEDHYHLPEQCIGVSRRIGIDGAGEDALLPYRFYVSGNKFVSAPHVK